MDSRFSNHGISLLEIVVACTLLFVLAALLLPTLSSFVYTSERMRCSSNLRQIGAATLLYCQDHDGLFPGPTNAAQNSTYTASQLRAPRSLIHFVHGYLDLADPPSRGSLTAEVFKCFSSEKALAGNNPNGAYFLHRGTDLGNEGIPRPFGFYPSTVTGTVIYPIKLQTLTSPGRTVLLMDRGGSADIPEVHIHSRNILFADGRVESVELHRFHLDAVNVRFY